MTDDPKRAPIERQSWECPLDDRPPQEPIKDPYLEKFPGYWPGGVGEQLKQAKDLADRWRLFAEKTVALLQRMTTECEHWKQRALAAEKKRTDP